MFGSLEHTKTMISLSPTHELLAVMSDNNASFYVRQSKLNVFNVLNVQQDLLFVFMCIKCILNCVVLCVETFRQSNSGFEEFNNFVLKWDGMLRILKDWSDER